MKDFWCFLWCFSGYAPAVEHSTEFTVEPSVWCLRAGQKHRLHAIERLFPCLRNKLTMMIRRHTHPLSPFYATGSIHRDLRKVFTKKKQRYPSFSLAFLARRKVFFPRWSARASHLILAFWLAVGDVKYAIWCHRSFPSSRNINSYHHILIGQASNKITFFFILFSTHFVV